METTINKIGTQTIVAINGRLDTPSSKAFEESIQSILRDDKLNLYADCTALEYISSSNLCQFLTLLKYTKNANGTMKIENLNSEVKEVFDMTGFSGIFNLIKFTGAGIDNELLPDLLQDISKYNFQTTVNREKGHVITACFQTR